MSKQINSPKNRWKGIVLMLFCSICLCTGQLIWKLMPNFSLIHIIGGFFIFGIGALAMIFAYRYGDLSVLQPINSTSYVFSLILGSLIFQEQITSLKITGVAMIMIGVILLGISGNT
ncbi:EamA family transporter [Treponema primitia]|uniref:EamA family transporter n=1 Tax=Treponema primitia TaxID=88058 RepID=UPI00397FBF8A